MRTVKNFIRIKFFLAKNSNFLIVLRSFKNHANFKIFDVNCECESLDSFSQKFFFKVFVKILIKVDFFGGVFWNILSF